MISCDRCFSCFVRLPRPLGELLYSNDSKLRTASFVILANLAENGIRVPFDDALAAAASLIVSQPPEVKAICVRFAEDFAADAAPFDASIVPADDQYAREFKAAVANAALLPRLGGSGAMRASISEDSEDFRPRQFSAESDFAPAASTFDERDHLLSSQSDEE